LGATLGNAIWLDRQSGFVNQAKLEIDPLEKLRNAAPASSNDAADHQPISVDDLDFASRSTKIDQNKKNASPSAPTSKQKLNRYRLSFLNLPTRIRKS